MEENNTNGALTTITNRPVDPYPAFQKILDELHGVIEKKAPQQGPQKACADCGENESLRGEPVCSPCWFEADRNAELRLEYEDAMNAEGCDGMDD